MSPKTNKKKGKTKRKPTLKTALSRVARIERRLGMSHEVQDLLDRMAAKGKPSTTASKVLASFPALKEDVTVSVSVTDLVFDLDVAATTATLTRVYLPGQPDIASSAKPHGVLPRQISGSTVIVVMETLGDAGELGKFNVQGALQKDISLLAEDSPSLKPLIVS
jgi:hypothetical protein